MRSSCSRVTSSTRLGVVSRRTGPDDAAEFQRALLEFTALLMRRVTRGRSLGEVTSGLRIASADLRRRLEQ